jgi:hypothetical protein
MAAEVSPGMFAGLPELVINQSDVYNCWKRWSDEFTLVMEMRSLEMGSTATGEGADAVVTQRFTEAHTLLAFRMAIGQEGRNLLHSKGFKPREVESTFEIAYGMLRDHYAREDNIFVKTQNFVTVRQATAEDDRDYLLRVERLSRQVEIAADLTRQRFALTLAVNGLRDSRSRRELMAREDLSWANLTTVLKARKVAQAADEVLSSETVSTQSIVNVAGGNSPTVSRTVAPTAQAEVTVKSEVAEVRKRSASPSSRYDREDRDYSRQGSRYRNDRNDYESRSDHGYQDTRSDRSGTYRVPARRDDYEGRPRSRDRSREGYRVSAGRSPSWGRGYSPRGRSPSPRVRWHSARADSPYRSRQYSDSDGDRGQVCFKCERKGHYARYCPEATCNNCLKRGHMSRDCKQQVRCLRCMEGGHKQFECPSRKTAGKVQLVGTSPYS